MHAATSVAVAATAAAATVAAATTQGCPNSLVPEHSQLVLEHNTFR